MVLELFPSLAVTVTIVGFGLAIHVTLGYLRSITESQKEIEKITEINKTLSPPKDVPQIAKFSKHKALMSVIVGSITGLVLVLPQVKSMGVDPIQDIILSVTLVGTVAGIDAIAKKSGLGEK